jgi:hypothetical protein
MVCYEDGPITHESSYFKISLHCLNRISAKEILGYYKLEQYKAQFDKGYSKHQMKGNKANCNGNRIQSK